MILESRVISVAKRFVRFNDGLFIAVEKIVGKSQLVVRERVVRLELTGSCEMGQSKERLINPVVHVRGGKPDAKPNRRAWKHTQQILDTYILPHWKSLPINEIRRRDVIELTEPIKKTAPYSANHAFRTVRKVFNWMVRMDIIEVSPCHGLKQPHKPQPRNRVLSDDKIRRFWDATLAMGYPFGDCYRLLLVTGQRTTECAAMTRAELELQHAE